MLSRVGYLAGSCWGTFTKKHSRKLLLRLVFMPVKKLTILESRPTSQSAFLTNGVLSCWHNEERPEVKNLTLDQFLANEQHRDRTGTAWIILDQFGAANFSAAIAKLQEREIPIMLTRSHEIAGPGSTYQAGIVIGPPGAPPTALCAILRTLWSQSEVLEHLRSEIRYLQAHQGGLCDQMGKIDEELRLAAQLQREFLPHTLPDLPECSFQILFRPASYVSGDIYDVMRLDEDHVGFFLADAVGHGVPAALMTMYIKRSLRTKAADPQAQRGYRIISPAEALGQLNVDLANQPTEQIRFATACYGILNRKTLELTVARAGHPYPLLLRHRGEPQWLKPEGAMLGVFDEEVYEDLTYQLHPGDRVMFYSDGFELAFPQGDGADDQAGDLANTHYEEEFIKLGNIPSEVAMEHLAMKLDNQAGSLNQRDDLSVVWLSVREKKAAEAAALYEQGKSQVLSAAG